MHTERHSRRWLLALIGLLAWQGTLLAVPPVNHSFFRKIAIEGYDPVAYFKESKPVKGSSDFTYEWHGAKWLFSSAENLAAFKQTPEKYAPQYGGYCAWAVANNSTAGIDPQAWKIVDGKLYLNYNKEIQAKWEKDMAACIKKADANWPGLVDKE